MDHDKKIEPPFNVIDSVEHILQQFDVSLDQQKSYNVAEEFKKTQANKTTYIFIAVFILGVFFSVLGFYFLVSKQLNNQFNKVSSNQNLANTSGQDLYIIIKDIRSRIDDIEFSTAVLKQSLFTKNINRDKLLVLYRKKALIKYSGSDLEEKLAILESIKSLFSMENDKIHIINIIIQNNQIIDNLQKSLYSYESRLIKSGRNRVNRTRNHISTEK